MAEKRVGEAEATRTSNRAAKRGTNYHTITEHYIKNILDLDEHEDRLCLCRCFVLLEMFQIE